MCQKRHKCWGTEDNNKSPLINIQQQKGREMLTTVIILQKLYILSYHVTTCNPFTAYAVTFHGDHVDLMCGHISQEVHVRFCGRLRVDFPQKSKSGHMFWATFSFIKQKKRKDVGVGCWGNNPLPPILSRPMVWVKFVSLFRSWYIKHRQYVGVISNHVYVFNVTSVIWTVKIFFVRHIINTLVETLFQ